MFNFISQFEIKIQRNKCQNYTTLEITKERDTILNVYTLATIKIKIIFYKPTPFLKPNYHKGADLDNGNVS